VRGELDGLDDGRDHYRDGVVGEAGKMDKSSAMMVVTSRKEGDVQRDTATEPEVETVAMFECSEDVVATMDKGSGTRSTTTKARAEARLRMTTTTTRARLREKQGHDRELGN
jgi:hypothetical protein